MQISEIQPQLKNGTIPENGEIDVATGDVIIAYANDLADRLDACANSGVAGVSDFAATLRLISWCYPIETKLVNAEKVDRLSSMFSGPFFTSEKYPWPQNDDKYYEPVAQIDLADVNELSAVKFEDGIFQLWVDGFLPDEYVIRIIPREECVSEALSPVPECIDSEYYDEIERTGDSDLAWPAIHYIKKVPAVYIFEEKFGKNLSWSGDLEGALSHIVGKIDNSRIVEDLKHFISLFPNDNPSTEPHLFGTFSPICYYPTDENPTFLALEGGPCFSWNYGNAQVSYRVDEQGSVEFGFACSCQ